MLCYSNGTDIFNLGCPKDSVFCDEISCRWVRGFPSNESVKEKGTI